MNKQQLANRVWAVANKLRGKIEANEYKDYILGLIFYKFLCYKEEEILRNDFDFTDEDLKDLSVDNPEMTDVIEECQARIG